MGTGYAYGAVKLDSSLAHRNFTAALVRLRVLAIIETAALTDLEWSLQRDGQQQDTNLPKVSWQTLTSNPALTCVCVIFFLYLEVPKAHTSQPKFF